VTTLTTNDFIGGLTDKDLARLTTLHFAWSEAIRAYGAMGEADGNELRDAIRNLIEETDDREAGMKAAQAYTVLRRYPMPDLGEVGVEDEADDAMWDLFFQLVLAVQADDKLRMDAYAEQLETLAAGTGLGVTWWLARAKAYAPLGLTIATRV